MLHRNVDFFALFFIVLGLLVSSKLATFNPAISLPPVPQPIHFQNAQATDQCPVAAEVLSRLTVLFDR